MNPHTVRIVIAEGTPLWTCPGCKNRWASANTEMALRHQEEHEIAISSMARFVQVGRELERVIGRTWKVSA